VVRFSTGKLRCWVVLFHCLCLMRRHHAAAPETPVFRSPTHVAHRGSWTTGICCSTLGAWLTVSRPLLACTMATRGTLSQPARTRLSAD
jgi:hypothetical protein